MGRKFVTFRSETILTACSKFCLAQYELRMRNLDDQHLPKLGIRANYDSFPPPLHELETAFDSLRTKIPQSTNFLPVVPSIVDPYRACTLAPDHLLCGLARGSFVFLLKLLRSRSKIELLEDSIRYEIRKRNLNFSNSLVNFEEEKLHTTSISELYSLISVADTALLPLLHL